MSADTFRAMFKEMVDWIDDETHTARGQDPLVTRARTLLAQPETEVPSPISAHDLAIQWNQQADQSEQWDSLELYEQLVRAQVRAIAADRGRIPTPQPEQEVEATPNDDDAWLFPELVSEVARVQHVAAGEGQGPRFDLAEAVARCCHPATPPALPLPESTNE